ncbi:TRAP-type C4-dicarboxylate transport system, small permease component (plasmid) [Sinorhizobium sojae CCBAU 05684]|uniref:TRAP transporter small permease protein n=1 Tax=Sinorhizobium sojae CCBAU 05684 TaxID=716928 RepID=A0A249PJ94_9HYPH|nr:TRAP transporter small permease [Sinorhizobium sojae]ASY66010.1 TRAP-type C4-dicarboxylate transport system, small permease component [Sinorhizobium sojae CCBAU 05684]
MGRLVSILWAWIDAIMATLLAAMIALVFANVVLRYGFSSGIRSSVELSRLGFVWVVMFGAAVALRRGEHLAVTEFSAAFFPRAVPVLQRLCWLVILVAVVMLLWGAARQTLANWHNISPLTGLPTGLMYLPGAIAGALMAAIAIARLIHPVETKTNTIGEGR